MPTGYTIGVQNGTITDSKDFIAQCARNFGALIMMRDDPMDAPIPDEFKPSEYNLTRLEEAKSELSKLQLMSAAEIELAVEEDYIKTLEKNRKYYEKSIEERNRYISMLAKVKEWQPPTEDHTGLKKFCIQQLEESIRFDCDASFMDRYSPEKTKKATPAEWMNQNTNRCLRDIEYHSKAHAEEIERTNNRNKWIKELKESFL